MRPWIAAAAAAAAMSLTPAGPAQAYDETPMRLPRAPVGAAAAATQAPTWLVAARRGPAPSRIARRHGAQALGVAGVHRLPAARARAFAADLERAGALAYAEPDVRLRRTSALDVAPQLWARPAIVADGLVPPAPSGVTIAVVDDLVDTSLPDLAHVRQLHPGPVLGPHGTMVASAAAAAFNGSGVFGIFPSAPLLSVGISPQITCGEAAEAISAAAVAGARIINLSFGAPDDCTTLFVAVQVAYARGSLVIAAAGNEFAAGNPVIYPAAYPHVLSVAALDAALAPSAFSSENTAVDVAAPGVQVPVAIPPAMDGDGNPDGITLADGTSFAAPLVAGAASWLATARPQLSNGQLADVLRRSARDVSTPGYDAGSGFGLVRMAEALALPTPPADVLEPNDGILFVDGTVFGKADPFVWRGTGKRSLQGSVDQVEDPVDVYRVSVPRRAAVKVELRASFGDPNLALYDAGARGLDDSAAILARSRKGPRQTEVVRFTNNTSRARTRYVVVDIAANARTLDASYTIRYQRVRRGGR